MYKLLIYAGNIAAVLFGVCVWEDLGREWLVRFLCALTLIEFGCFAWAEINFQKKQKGS